MQLALGVLEREEPRRDGRHRILLVGDVREAGQLPMVVDPISFLAISRGDAPTHQRVDHVRKLLVADARQAEYDRVDLDVGGQLHAQHGSVEQRNCGTQRVSCVAA